jgi:DNA-binding CsgD family transcriptional regulator/PAS domain-containing protein
MGTSQKNMIQQPGVFSDLVADIYDAAFDPASWTEVLARICEFTSCRAAGLLSKDTISKCGTAHFHHGVDPHHMRSYVETYMRLAPTTMTFFDVGQLVCVRDVLPYDELLKTRFYREWLRPQGVVDGGNVLLEKSATSCAYLGILRDDAAGMVDDELRRRLALIVPHVRRAMLIGKAIDLRQYEAATFADTLDGLSAGICLVDARGRIVHANAAGQAILDAGDTLRAAGGRLIACDARVDQTLREVFFAAGQGDAALGTMGIAVPLIAGNGERYVAHVLPLTSGARRHAGMTCAAVAAVFVRQAALAVPSAFEVIGKTFGLTPMEQRVLLAIVDVGGVPEVAEALGVAITTIKTHLRRLFDKTGAARQADLVKLVAGYATPLAG